MYKINIELTENGVIKTIDDNNSDGLGTQLISKKIYLLSDKNQCNVFIRDICHDIGISSIGSDIELLDINRKKISLWQKIKNIFS